MPTPSTQSQPASQSLVESGSRLDQVKRLWFAEPEFEADFQADHAARSLLGLRNNLLIAIPLFGFWAVADLWLVPDCVAITWPFRFGQMIAAAGLLALARASTRSRRASRWLFPSRVLFTAYNGFALISCAVATGMFGHRHYYAGLILNAFACSVTPGQRFRIATILIWTTSLAYLLLLAGDRSISAVVLVNNTMFLVAANLLSMSASYAMECHLRTDFVQRRTIQEQAETLRQALRDVERGRVEAEHRSRTDQLTGLYNRRHFFDEAARRPGRFSVVILDVDHFKSINDRFGHLAGDSVLREVATRVRVAIRHEDVACRYGGEEFAVLLPNTDLVASAAIGERIRRAVEAEPFETGSSPLPVTISVGVATIEDDVPGIEVLIDRADRALYQAKTSGRNLVKLWQRGQTLVQSH